MAREAPPTDNLVEEFLESLRQEGLAPATVQAYAYDLAVFMRWWSDQAGPRTWSELGADDLLRYRRHMTEERGARAATVNRHVEALRRFSRWAFRLQHLASDLASEMERVRRVRRQQPRSLRDDEVQALLRAAGNSRGLALRNRALLQLFLQAGARVGEACGLRRQDAVIRERTGFVRLRHAKEGKERDVPLNATARRALKQYMDSRPRAGPTDLLFASTRGAAMSARSIQHLVKNLARRAGVTRIQVTAQTLRHTFSLAYLREHPGCLAELGALLGHDSLDSTALYGRPSPKAQAGRSEQDSLHARQ